LKGVLNELRFCPLAILWYNIRKIIQLQSVSPDCLHLAQTPNKIQSEGVKYRMTEQILGLVLSAVIWVGSMVGMVIGFGLKPVKWLRKAM
jgi:hypothetical protein